MASAFDVFARTDLDRHRYGESAYRYLNKSARAEASRVRDLLDDWFSRFPECEHKDWLGRFSSDKDVVHYGAFFELLLHAWTLRLGFEVTPHPELPETTNKPDFLAAGRDVSFIFEARTTLGKSPDEIRQNRFCEQVIGEIDQIPSPDFFVSVEFDSIPTQQPALASIRREIERWLGQLVYDDVLDAYGHKESASFSKEFPVADGQMVLEPLPKTNTRGNPRALGVHGLEVGWVNTQEPIQKALERKASRYGRLGKPYIVAINDLSPSSAEDHVDDALFGQQVFCFSADGRQWQKLDDSGFFGTRSNPRHRRVSAVIVFSGATPWSFAASVPVFVANPWAEYPIVQPLGECRGYFWDGKKLIRSDLERSCTKIFGLPSGWPRIA